MRTNIRFLKIKKHVFSQCLFSIRKKNDFCTFFKVCDREEYTDTYDKELYTHIHFNRFFPSEIVAYK